MRDEHRLCRAEMGEGRHERVGRRVRLGRQRADHARHRALQERNAPAQIQPQIQRHLLVPRTARVQAAPRVAEALHQQALDEAVDVLVRAVHERGLSQPLREDGGERVFDPARFVSRQHTGLRECPCPRDAPGHIVLEQAAVEAERGAELERGGVRRGVKTAGPQVSHGS